LKRPFFIHLHRDYMVTHLWFSVAEAYTLLGYIHRRGLSDPEGQVDTGLGSAALLQAAACGDPAATLMLGTAHSTGGLSSSLNSDCTTAAYYYAVLAHQSNEAFYTTFYPSHPPYPPPPLPPPPPTHPKNFRPVPGPSTPPPPLIPPPRMPPPDTRLYHRRGASLTWNGRYSPTELTQRISNKVTPPHCSALLTPTPTTTEDIDHGRCSCVSCRFATCVCYMVRISVLF